MGVGKTRWHSAVKVLIYASPLFSKITCYMIYIYIWYTVKNASNFSFFKRYLFLTLVLYSVQYMYIHTEVNNFQIQEKTILAFSFRGFSRFFLVTVLSEEYYLVYRIGTPSKYADRKTWQCQIWFLDWRRFSRVGNTKEGTKKL